MGSWLSKDAFILQIEDKKLTLKELRQIKTYKDAMKVAGFNIEDMTTLKVIQNNKIEYVLGHETFKIPDRLQYEAKWIYIRKLYGK